MSYASALFDQSAVDIHVRDREKKRKTSDISDVYERIAALELLVAQLQKHNSCVLQTLNTVKKDSVAIIDVRKLQTLPDEHTGKSVPNQTLLLELTTAQTMNNSQMIEKILGLIGKVLNKFDATHKNE